MKRVSKRTLRNAYVNLEIIASHPPCLLADFVCRRPRSYDIYGSAKTYRTLADCMKAAIVYLRIVEYRGVAQGVEYRTHNPEVRVFESSLGHVLFDKNDVLALTHRTVHPERQSRSTALGSVYENLPYFVKWARMRSK